MRVVRGVPTNRSTVPVKLRCHTPCDLGRMASIEAEAFGAEAWSHQEFHTFLQSDLTGVIVADVAGEVVGHLCWDRFADELTIHTCAVDIRYRGMGFGSAMVGLVKREINSGRGARRILAFVSEANWQRADWLWQNGFVAVKNHQGVTHMVYSTRWEDLQFQWGG